MVSFLYMPVLYVAKCQTPCVERFPEDFMFQLTKGEYEILINANLKSQIVTARSSESTNDSNLRSQIVTAKEFTKSRTLPYAFTEQGVAMLSSVLRSPLAIQVNIGIIRAFVEFRKLANSLPMPNTSEDIAQLRKDFEELKLDIEDILHDQNDINGRKGAGAKVPDPIAPAPLRPGFLVFPLHQYVGADVLYGDSVYLHQVIACTDSFLVGR